MTVAPMRDYRPRRVVLNNSRTWTSPTAIHAALSLAWGDGRAVLVTRPGPRMTDRYAAMLWRRWGGEIERHQGGLALHGRGAHRSGADVSVSFAGGGQVSSHDRCTQAVDRARRAVLTTREHQLPEPTLNHRATGRDDEHDDQSSWS